MLVRGNVKSSNLILGTLAILGTVAHGGFRMRVQYGTDRRSKLCLSTSLRICVSSTFNADAQEISEGTGSLKPGVRGPNKADHRTIKHCSARSARSARSNGNSAKLPQG